MFVRTYNRTLSCKGKKYWILETAVKSLKYTPHFKGLNKKINKK